MEPTFNICPTKPNPFQTLIHLTKTLPKTQDRRFGLIIEVESPNSGPPPGFSSKPGLSYAAVVVNGEKTTKKNEEIKEAFKKVEEGAKDSKRLKTSEGGILTIFLGNLSRDITEQKLSIFCGRFEKMLVMKIFKKQNGGVFGFVRYNKTEEARDAIKWLNNNWIMDKRVGVDWARYDLKLLVGKESKSKFDKGMDTVMGEEPTFSAELNLDFQKDLQNCARIVTRRFWEFSELFDRLTELDQPFKNFLRWGRYGFVIMLQKESDWGKWQQVKDEIHSDFVKVDKIDNLGGPFNRHVWLEVKGLLPVAWTRSNFKRIVSEWGQLLCMPDITEGLKRIDKAFVMIESNLLEKISAIRVIEVASVANKIMVNEIDLDDNWDYEKDDEFREVRKEKKERKKQKGKKSETEGSTSSSKVPVGEADLVAGDQSIFPFEGELSNFKKRREDKEHGTIGDQIEGTNQQSKMENIVDSPKGRPREKASLVERENDISEKDSLEESDELKVDKAKSILIKWFVNGFVDM